MSNHSQTVLASAARTATPTIGTFSNPTGKSIVLVVDVTVIAATPDVTVSILGVDRLSGKTWLLLASVSLATTGTRIYRVGPGLTAVNNLVANDVLPPFWTVTAVHGDTDSATYSIAAYLID